jgi:hypothetical protein
VVGFTEEQLDARLHAYLESSQEFLTWFLGRTKFAGRRIRILLLRSDNPWYQSKRTRKQPETDILLVLEDLDTNDRFALHIENKLANGKFGEDQPELYHERAEDWRGVAKWGSYADYEVVLVAPQCFFERNREKAELFHRFIPHEDIALFVPEFGASCDRIAR